MDVHSDRSGLYARKVGYFDGLAVAKHFPSRQTFSWHQLADLILADHFY